MGVVRRPLRGLAGALIVAAVVGTVLVPRPATATSAPKCNGHAELCRRRFDQVAFAATHNSMSTVADGFRSPDQQRSIADQLAGGVHAFLVDAYTGTPTTDHICTDPTPLAVAKIRRESGAAAVDQLLAIRNLQCPPAGGPNAAVYMCHDFCEFGATKFVDELAYVRAFLKSNPNDVVVLIIEDYAPASELMAAFQAAGLDKAMVRHEPRARWPRLAQMKRSGTRLVVFVQHQGGTAPGLLDAFREMNETPFSFHSAAELNCAPNRGPARAPLFLLNHWIDTSDKRAAADAVNAYDVLDARAKRCQQERGHLPNFVAVNFAEDGDLLRVVDDLNGVGTSSRR